MVKIFINLDLNRKTKPPLTTDLFVIRQITTTTTGLVIKAKSMFEEPIRIGLIRFADLYDQRAVGRRRRCLDKTTSSAADARHMNANEAAGSTNGNGNEFAEPSAEFNSNHQPTLVIYTTTTTTTTANVQRDQPV